MAISNRERVGRAFELLAEGLEPFVDGEMGAKFGDDWLEAVRSRTTGAPPTTSLSDPQFQLKAMWDYWNEVFRDVLGQAERTLVSELRTARNAWAHNERFSFDDTYRTLDSIQRLLTAVSAPQADAVAKSREEVMRQYFEAERRKATPTATAIATEPTAGLKPWREVITPHEDVRSGRFPQAEFAADLAQVRRGEGAPEYLDPVEFFRRTYITQGLEQLLTEAVDRLAANGGTPVVDLQTNFGGGKTHSLLALYHLFSGKPLEAFPHEAQDLVRNAGTETMPDVQRAVLVGTSLRPGQPDQKPDGVLTRTLWGELAWQLDGPDGYALLEEADRTGTNPGDSLRTLFERTSPCLILIDEWVAYARQLYSRDDLPAGTFDTHFSFAQALTEATRAVPGVLTVISIPASEALGEGAAGPESEGAQSEIEVGGVGGREALRRLRNVIGRMESSWRPASAEESFEIVRRRLFEPIPADAVPHRDATAQVLGEFYRSNSSDFPTECREPAYGDRMKAAYPIHPELFARLYTDWSALERFQRTRGVLRLMASVVHALWTRNDQAPLILPASVPIDDNAVATELTRHLEDNWKPVIDTDIDGDSAVSVQLDRELPNLGRYLAARRVARTIFIGSAPKLRSPHRGLEANRIRLGCVLPGESIATFGDALNRLTDRSTYLYVDGARYWYGVQPGVARMAQDRADQLLESGREDLHAELIRRLRAQDRDRGIFARVHIAPGGSADVPDEPEARLVILGPSHPHVARSDDSPALDAAVHILDQRGTAARLYRNMLLFLVADQRRLEELLQGIAECLAWRAITDEAEELNLDAHQARQARTKRDETDRTVDLRIAETYRWALVPTQPEPTGDVQWEAVRINGQPPLAATASRKLSNEGHLHDTFAPALLRMQLEGPLASMWSDGHVSAKALWEVFAQYLYLPRLRDIDVLLSAVSQGPARTDWEGQGFATADTVDENARYRGLTINGHAEATPGTLVVRPDVAKEKAESSESTEATTRQDASAKSGTETGTGEETRSADDGSTAEGIPQRFYGVVSLRPERLNRDFGNIAQEVITHLQGHVGTELEVTIEIRATNQSGFPDRIVRTVSENASALGFDAHEFEEE